MAVLFGDAPLRVADMVVLHHTVPLASCELFVVIIGETLVLFHKVAHGKAVAHRCGIIHHGYAGTCHCRIIHQLIESILGIGWDAFLQCLATQHY